MRRRTFAAPDDATVRARYEDAGHGLCVMVGHRMVHHAIDGAEQLVAVRRPDGAPGPSTAEPRPRLPHRRACRSGAVQARP
ncbi:DUF5133 domain-containing protein [Streptomyces sp. NPDC001502]|uniref:DUF5133 domain-containing protein n=1 Tax=Streptomyces sp. NPDC001502 TaxID=3364578 RepID=UPI0036933733